MSHFHVLRIADIRRETPDAVSLALDVPEELKPAFAFAPGQYLTLRTTLDGEEVRRSYSICSGLDEGELRIAVKRLPEGRFSGWAHERLRVGDTLEVMPPEGRFGLTPDPDAAHVYVAIAAGSGITPIMAILRSVLAREPGSRFVLLYGSRSSERIIFRDALHDLKDRYLGRLAVVHVLSREPQDVEALHGRLDAARIAALLPGLVGPAAIDRAFLCGPPGLIESAAAALTGLGVAPARIQVERFTPAADAGPPRAPAPEEVSSSAHRATIVHDGVRVEVPVAAGETVLDAGLRAGLDLPWSCHGGMCATCRARLTDGAVRMDENYALAPWELEAGYVLTCQAHPTTARVTADYDQV